MSKFIVYSGSNSNDDFALQTFELEQEVIDFYKRFMLALDIEDLENNSYVFRVFVGTELTVTPVEVVTVYKLEVAHREQSVLPIQESDR